MTQFFKQAFIQSGHRCVYCCRDLTADFDSFMLAEEDHLVPQSRGGLSVPENVVIACAVCNRLKGNDVPMVDFDPARPDEYIIAVRHLIMSKRAKQMDIFSKWVCLPAP